MSKEQKKGVQSIRLPDDVLERVSKLAARTGESSSFIIRQCIKAGLPRLESAEWNTFGDGIITESSESHQKKQIEEKKLPAKNVQVGFGARSASSS